MAIPRHVVQRQGNDCAVATVAMAANEPYERVAERSPVEVGTRGLFPVEVHDLLESATAVPWRTPGSGGLWPIGSFAADPEPLVALIRSPSAWQHWVAVQGGWIHDPEFPWRLDAASYPRRRWSTIMVIRPESALRLVFVQQFRS